MLCNVLATFVVSTFSDSSFHSDRVNTSYILDWLVSFFKNCKCAWNLKMTRLILLCLEFLALLARRRLEFRILRNCANISKQTSLSLSVIVSRASWNSLAHTYLAPFWKTSRIIRKAFQSFFRLNSLKLDGWAHILREDSFHFVRRFFGVEINSSRGWDARWPGSRFLFRCSGIAGI